MELRTNPAARVLLFLLFAFALMAPYLAFAIYCSFHYPPGHWPEWVVYTLLGWFVTNLLLLSLIASKTLRGAVVDAKKASAARKKLRIYTIWLVTVWSAFFLYGAKETIEGKLPLNRAIPAGLFLLLFIGLFGWSASRMNKSRG